MDIKENVEGENLIAKAGRNGVVRKQRQHYKSRSSSEGGGGGGGEGEEGGNKAPKAKRAQYCTICKNHNQRVLKKRHKCPHSDCQCPLCQLSRRVQCIMCHQQRLWRFRKSMEKNGSSQNTKDGSVPIISSPSSSSSSSFAEGDFHLQESLVDDPSALQELAKPSDRMKPERHGKQQVCDKCRNHDEWVLKRGHKGKCPYESCNCKYCSFTIKRRNLMKHQQRVRRAQVISQPTKGKKDYVLQPAETPIDQEVSPLPSAEESTISPRLLNATTSREVLNDTVSQHEIQDCTSPAISTGLSPGIDLDNGKEMPNHMADQNKSQIAWLSCSNEKSPSARGSRMVSSDNRQLRAISPETTIPLVKSDSSLEHCVSPAISQSLCISQVVSPGRNYESSLSPAISHDISHEQHFTQVNRSDSRISPEMSTDSMMLSPLHHESKIPQANCYEPRVSSVMCHNPTTSLANSHESSISQMTTHASSISLLHNQEQRMSHQTRLSLANRNEPRFSHEPKFSQTMSHEPKFSQTMSHEPKFSQLMANELRISTNSFNEPNRECTAFHQQNTAVNQGTGYSAMTDETMHSPIHFFKEEPITDDAMFYDNMETVTPCTDYASDVQEFDSSINFITETDIHLMRQNHHKFGLESDDLQLRNWTNKSVRSDQSYPETYQGNNFRGSSLCIPLPQPQPPLLPQHSPMNQQAYYPVMQTTSSTTFETPSVAYGWGSSVVQPSIATPRSHSSEVIQSRHAIVSMANCEAYVQPHQNQSQSLWWQHARVTSLERTNSC